MVKEGLGVAVLPMLSVCEERNVKSVKLDPGFTRTIGVIYRKTDFRERPELRDFVEYIKQIDFDEIKG